MNRRDALLFLTSGAACAVPFNLAKAAQWGNLTTAEFEHLLRDLVKVEPLPGEAERIKQRLSRPTIDIESDPRIQPAIGFDPEVEV